MRILDVALTGLVAMILASPGAAQQAPQLLAEDTEAAAHSAAGEEGRGELRMISFEVTESAPRVHGAIYAVQQEWPSRRWFSVSQDGGRTWSDPEPWTWDDGEAFYSPSSMSVLLKHSSGRVFWVGNVSGDNCNGNSPRWPVVMGEVDPHSLTLIRESALLVDTRRPEDEDRGRLDLCHFRMLEDRETGEIILSYPRAHNKYQWREWATARIAVQ
ncbi:MAG: sialidase family protein [Armatimonadota bacterium]